MMRKFVYIVFSLLLCGPAFAQHGEVDSTKYHKVDEQMQKAQEFFTTGNVDSILHYYHTAQNMAQEFDLKEKLSDTYYEEAKLYLMMNDREHAMEMFKKAADNARQNSYWMGLNKALGQMASVSWMAGENVEGLQYAKEAVEAGQNAKYDRGVAIGYLQAGNILQNLARNEEALQSYLEASKYFDKCGFKSGVASCWINMAGIYYTLESFDLALEYDRKAMDLQRSLGNMGEVANVMQNMAAIYAGFNRQNAVTKYSHLDSAFYYYNEAIKVYEEQKD